MELPEINKAVVDPGNGLKSPGSLRSARPRADGLSGKTDALPEKLTPEEQMELYEKYLKENDWGHQPC